MSIYKYASYAQIESMQDLPACYATATMANFLAQESSTSSSSMTTSRPLTAFDIAEHFLMCDDDLDSPIAGVQDTHFPGSSSGSSTRNDEIRVAFRTKSEIEILEDGFKWRKYGKKSVKNNSNPRNYYRCSMEGCWVKKRVERDRDDPSYVITTYDGRHNHPSPCLVYDTQRDSTSDQFVVSGIQMRPSSS